MTFIFLHENDIFVNTIIERRNKLCVYNVNIYGKSSILNIRDFRLTDRLR